MSQSKSETRHLIEAHWITYRTLVMARNAPPIQLRECRMAFFAGAAAMFDSLFQGFSGGTEATEEDLEHITSVREELDAFLYEQNLASVKGQA
jgi:hypothetical protein